MWQTETDNAIIRRILLKLALFTYWFFFTYPFLLLCSLRPNSAVTNLRVFPTLSCYFLWVAGWWLPYSYRYFLLQWESQVHFTPVQYVVFSRLPELNFVGHWAIHSYSNKTRDCAGKTAYNGIPSHSVNEYQPVAKYRQMTINPSAPAVRLKTTKSLRKETAAKAAPCK